MNKFDEHFVIERVMAEFVKNTKKVIPVKCVSRGIKCDESEKKSVFIVVLNPILTGGIIGFGVYFGEKNKLMIYDSNGNIISVHDNMMFRSMKKGKVRKVI